MVPSELEVSIDLWVAQTSVACRLARMKVNWRTYPVVEPLYSIFTLPKYV